jgi:4-carboxymuconolactone decarboxylase
MSQESYDKGIEVFRTLGLGGPSGPQLPEDFRAMTTEHLFGDVWSRPGLELRDRSMITVTTLAALGRDPQLRVHLRGALNVGITPEQLQEMFMHLAHYAGWPMAVSAFQALADVLAESAKDET